jgi:peptidoglycan/xylan/chitin deacetylase (PgdA/CDA1 family)
MRYLGLCCSFVALSLSVLGQGRSVAITVDDLPYADGGAPAAANTSEAASLVRIANRRLLEALQAHYAPVTGFVIQKTVESLGPEAGPGILKEWTKRGFDLGNHTYSHPDINGLSVEQIEKEIVRGEIAIGPLMKESGKKLAYFRFPFNHTGDNKEKHDTVAAFLSQRGYRSATCTIDNSDYLFNAAYVRMLARNDGESAKRLRAEYLAYTSTEIDYYAALNRQVLGYEPPQVMLLHDNRLNADVIEQVLQLFAGRQYRFVSLDTAQADAAYQTPETFMTKFGPMWGYRWANERNVKVNGSSEPDPPNWILQYSKASAQ